MSSGIILTQIPSSTDTKGLLSLAAPGAPVECYAPAGWTKESALLQCFDASVRSIDLSALPGFIEDKPIGRFSASLRSDTGAAGQSPPFLMMVAFNVPTDAAQEVERWYEEEHIPMLMRAPGWLRARRFEVIEAVGARHYTSIALHDLQDLEVLDSKERALARSTAWRARLEHNDWFQQAGRFLYRAMSTSQER